MFTLHCNFNEIIKCLQHSPVWSYNQEQGLGLHNAGREDVPQAVPPMDTDGGQRLEKATQMMLELWNRGTFLGPEHALVMAAALQRPIYLYGSAFNSQKQLQVPKGSEFVAENILLLQDAYDHDLSPLANNIVAAFPSSAGVPLTIMHIG